MLVLMFLAGLVLGAVLKGNFRGYATRSDVEAMRTSIRRDQIALTRFLRDEIKKLQTHV